MKTTFLAPLCFLLVAELTAQLRGEFYFDIIENQKKDFTYTMREVGMRLVEVRCLDYAGNEIGKGITTFDGSFQTDGHFTLDDVFTIVLEYIPSKENILGPNELLTRHAICYLDTYAQEQPLQSGAQVPIVLEVRDLYLRNQKFISIEKYDYILSFQPIGLVKI